MNKRQKKKRKKTINERFKYIENFNILGARQCGKTKMQSDLMKIILDERYRLFKKFKKYVEMVNKL